MENIILHVYYRCTSGVAQDFVRAIKESGAQDLTKSVILSTAATQKIQEKADITE